MRRTQLYLDDQLWEVLHTRAKSSRTTISELVREAVRAHYLGGRDQRMKAMQEFVAIRKVGPTAPSPVEYVRRLRKGDRLDRLQKV